MTPLEREEVAKLSIAPMSTSINDDDPRGSDEPDRGAGNARNKYLNRIGVGDAGSASDTEPLLQ